MKNSVAYVIKYAVNLRLEQHRVVTHPMLQYCYNLIQVLLHDINLNSSTV